MQTAKKTVHWAWAHKLRSTAFMVVAFAAVGFVVTALSNDGNSASASVTRAALGTPQNPAVGNQQNDNPVLDTVEDWRDLVDAVNRDNLQWYRDCLNSRIGVTWEQAEQYAKLVDQGHDLRFILVSNLSISDDEARQMLRDRGFDDVDDLRVVRVSGFRNTRGLPSDNCNPFGDGRSQVRISLAVPKDVNDLGKGFYEDRGVLAMCSNPWDMFPPPPPVTPEQEKCFDAAGNPIHRDANGFCGTPTSGPEKQPVQSEPLSDPKLNDPTPGYTRGRAETNHQRQEAAATDDNGDITNGDTYTPSPNGEAAPSEQGTSGSTETPSGTTDSGTNDGVSNPDNSAGHQDDPVNQSDPGAP